MRLQAEEIFYDEEKNLIHAIGKVEASHGQRLMLSNRVTYNQNTQKVYAEGSVVLVEPDGTVHFSDRLEITDDLKNGIATNLRIRLTDDSRFAANGAIRKRGVRTEMSKGVYTPCKPCREEPNRPPLWQIRANKIIHDQKTHDIEYKHAVFEFLGFPFFYTPYLSHPDPSVKRRSGFLAPRIQNSNLLGLVLGTPYYEAVNNHFDLTIEPIFVTGKNLTGATNKNADFHIIGRGQARAEFASGSVEVEGSLTKANLENRSGITKKAARGDISSQGEFDINRDWRWGWDYNRSSDQTYLRRYGFSSENVLTQRIFAEGFRGRNYILAETIGFQDLRSSSQGNETPRSIPTLNYDFMSKPSQRGHFFTFNANTANLFRNEGQDSHRLSLGGGWHAPVTTRGGHVVSFDVTLRGDMYYVKDRRESGKTGDDKAFRGRIFPQTALSWRYPLSRPLGRGNIIVEPMAALAASFNGNNPDRIPNEDSLAFEFDDSDLFNPNRFVGYDRVESGQRLDYGMLLGVFGPRAGSAQFFLGQSYRLQKDSTFDVGSGLDEKLSDLVGRFILRTRRRLDIQGRFRMDKDNFKPLLAEIGFSAGPPIAKWSGTYLFADNQAASGKLGQRNEINLNLNSQITDSWRVFAGGTRDLTVNDGMRYVNFGFGYDDDCFRATVTASRSYTRDRDIEPTDSVTFLLFFKNFGELTI